MAIPQFDSFRKKARGSEAKTGLGALYTSEKAYFFENTAYIDTLQAVGFSVEGAQRHFRIGFAGTCVYPVVAATTCTSATNGLTPTASPGASCVVATGGVSFIAGALGDPALIDSGWQINNIKELEIGASGCGI